MQTIHDSNLSKNKRTMKSQNLVNKLFTDAGRPEQGDNRSFIIKALNKVLSDGIIKIKISEKGMIFTNPKYVDADGKLRQFNVQVEGYGWIRRANIKPNNYLSADDVLKVVGNFLNNPNVAEAHKKSLTVSGYQCVDCSRCNGRGVIPAFSYYCGGICFDCYGSKYMIEKVSITV